MNDLNVDNKKLIDAMKMMRENPTEIVKNVDVNDIKVIRSEKNFMNREPRKRSFRR